MDMPLRSYWYQVAVNVEHMCLYGRPCALIAVERDHSLWFVLPHCIIAESPQPIIFLYVANAVARSVTLCGQFPHVADDNVMADVSQSLPQR